MKDELKRCFIAINFPKNAVNEIKRAQDFLSKSNIFVGRFTDSKNLHLTLKFLGEINDDKIETVKDRLKKLVFSEINCELGEIGVFSEKLLRIIWIKVDGEIIDLQKEVNDILENLFEKEKRFMSHATIARIKYVENKNKFFSVLKEIEVNNIKFCVKEFSLMESKLNSNGVVYRELEKYRLKSK